MGSSLEDHVSFCDENSVNKLIAVLLRSAWLPSSCNEDSPFSRFNAHEVCWDLVTDRSSLKVLLPNIVHVEIVSVVDEEVESVFSILGTLDRRDSNRLFDHFLE